MPLESSILQKLKKLPDTMQQAVLLYAELLVTQITQKSERQPTVAPDIKSDKRGGLGMWKDKIWISDDFNEPLDDFQEYM